MIRLEEWKLGFQDSGTKVGESIISLHNEIMYNLIVIIVTVVWIIKCIIRRRIEISLKYMNHGKWIELIWTVTPGIILLIIAIPSFKLLYLMDEVIDSTISVRIIGNQWYWNYNIMNKDIDSYIKLEEELKIGELRQLEVDNRLVLPIRTHIRLIVTSNDVIHSFSVPSLGIKVDAIPGRLNQTSLEIKREGLFSGVCMEQCGTGHSKMPIMILGCNVEKFVEWVI